MGMVEKAKYELELLRGKETPDEMQLWVESSILEIIETFAKQGHSGFSANYCISIIEKLLRQEPILPLTGDADEWTPEENGISQNKRLVYIFKEGNLAYNVHGKIFSDDNGKSWFTNGDSKTPVTFPYTPKPPEEVIL